MASVTGIRGRYFAKLFLSAMEFYFRHKTTIDPHLSTACVTSLENVATFGSEIKSLNPAGPG